jgi:hypothetical protein
VVVWAGGIPEQLFNHAGVPGIILNQEYRHGRCAHVFPSGGSFTSASQKSSIPRTTIANCSSPPAWARNS